MTQKLRIRYARGSCTIENGRTAAVVGQRIEEATGIPVGKQEWKCGYPPKPSVFAAEDPLPFGVDSIHVSEGDTPSLKFPPPPEEAPGTIPGIADWWSSHQPRPPAVDPEGFVVRRVVKADNSCLFHSIANAFSSQQAIPSSQALHESLRKAVGQTIAADPVKYSEAFLGRPNPEYVEWIEQPTSWGGQIELSLLSEILQTQIVALDVVRNRHDIYGGNNDDGTDNNNNNKGYPRRIYVLYDGIHYDAIAYSLDPQQLPPEMDTTVFDPEDEVVMERARVLCADQHRQKAFTDTSRFTLKCLVCQQGLPGPAEAVQHANATGHTNFAEYTP